MNTNLLTRSTLLRVVALVLPAVVGWASHAATSHAAAAELQGESAERWSRPSRAVANQSPKFAGRLTGTFANAGRSLNDAGCCPAQDDEIRLGENAPP